MAYDKYGWFVGANLDMDQLLRRAKSVQRISEQEAHCAETTAKAVETMIDGLQAALPLIKQGRVVFASYDDSNNAINVLAWVGSPVTKYERDPKTRRYSTEGVLVWL